MAQHEDYIDTQMDKVKRAHDPIWGYSIQIMANNSDVKTHWLSLTEKQREEIHEILYIGTLK